MQTERSIDELKTELGHLASASAKHSEKLDSLHETILVAKGFLKALTWIGGIGGAIGIALRAAIFKTLGDHLTK